MKNYAIAGFVGFCSMIIPNFALSIYQTGVQLPQSVVHNMQGQQVNLQNFKGKPVVINFWASWCPPCRKEMPVLQAAQKK
jgi:thiol-disulfide isomerase/thioredoxin